MYTFEKNGLLQILLFYMCQWGKYVVNIDQNQTHHVMEQDKVFLTYPSMSQGKELYVLKHHKTG